MKEKQVYTNVSPTDDDSNGQTLILKNDHTFDLDSRNYAWDSHDHFTWSSAFYINGIWSYDKELKKITLTATKFSASLSQPLKDQQNVLEKGFTERVVTTTNFDI